MLDVDPDQYIYSGEVKETFQGNTNFSSDEYFVAFAPSLSSARHSRDSSGCVGE